MINHIYISVSNIDKSRKFYAAALKPLGWRELGKYDSSHGPDSIPDLYGFGDDEYGSGAGLGSSIWLRQRQPGETGLYVGIEGSSTLAVDTAYAAALKAGGKDEGAPANRTYFAPGYYAANIGDLDDNHLEFTNRNY